MNNVGQRIKQHIHENCLKQVRVAEKADIPNPIFNAMLNGKRKIYINEYAAICEALNVSADTFIK